MFGAVMVVCAISNLVVQGLLVRQAFRDRRYALPLVATCATTAWDCLVLFPSPVRVVDFTFPLPSAVLMLFPLLDLALVVPLLLFGRADFPRWSKPAWYAIVAGLLALSFVSVYVICRIVRAAVGDAATVGWTVTMLSVLIDASFVMMLRARRSLAGQSMTIAVCKPVAMGSATIGFWLFWPGLSSSVALGVLVFVDLGLHAWYIAAVHRVRTADSGREPANASWRT